MVPKHYRTEFTRLSSHCAGTDQCVEGRVPAALKVHCPSVGSPFRQSADRQTRISATTTGSGVYIPRQQEGVQTSARVALHVGVFKSLQGIFGEN